MDDMKTIGSDGGQTVWMDNRKTVLGEETGDGQTWIGNWVQGMEGGWEGGDTREGK